MPRRERERERFIYVRSHFGSSRPAAPAAPPGHPKTAPVGREWPPPSRGGGRLEPHAAAAGSSGAGIVLQVFAAIAAPRTSAATPAATIFVHSSWTPCWSAPGPVQAQLGLLTFEAVWKQSLHWSRDLDVHARCDWSRDRSKSGMGEIGGIWEVMSHRASGFQCCPVGLRGGVEGPTSRWKRQMCPP